MEHLHLNTTLAHNTFQTVTAVASACATCDFSCFFESGISTEQKCMIAKEGCASEGKFDQFNFFYLLFCTFSGNIFIFMPVAIFAIYLIFGFISATVEEYISGGITYISEYFQLSEALAAVTLLALANGAGDVITAIVSSSSEGGISYNIGALYGAGFFVCSMVICLTILSSTDVIVVDKSTIFRDIGFYILSTIVTIIYAFIGNIYPWSAILFLFIYVMMVFVVYVQDRLELREKEKEEQEQNNQKEIENFSIGMKQSHSHNPLKKLKNCGNNVLNKIKVAKAMNTLVAKKRLLRHATLVTEQSGNYEDLEEEEKSFSEMNIFEKLMYPFEFILDFIRKITMPPSEEDKYDKTLCIIWPFPGILFLLYGFGQLTYNNILFYGIPLAFILSMIFYYTQKDLEEKQIPNYFLLISTLSTIVGLIWTYIACAMLIDMLNVFIIVFKLNQTYMGLTILGVGNALPDALTTVALAKKGYAQMGITGSYAGQLFGLLVGFGIAQLKTTLISGPQDFSLFQKPVENLLDILVIGFCFINLVVTALYGIYYNYHFKRGLAYIIGAFYAVFIFAATVVQIYYLLNGIQ